MITERQHAEVKRCEMSSVYFTRRYSWFQHPLLGPVRHIPWDWQEAHLRLWQAWRPTQTLKSRQMGFSITGMSFLAWLGTFRPHINVLLLSQKEEKAKSLLSKLVFIHEHIPDWMRTRARPSKGHLEMSMKYWDETAGKWRDGGGSFSSLTTTGQSGAGETATVVFVDEFALMAERGIDKSVWAAIGPTIIHGGLIVTGSTPRGCAGQFYMNWNQCIQPLMESGIVTPLPSPGETDENIMTWREWLRAVLVYARDNPRGVSTVPMIAHYSMCYHNEQWIRDATRGLSEVDAAKVREHFGAIKYDAAWVKEIADRLKFSPAQIAQEFELQFDRPGGQVFSPSDLTASYIPATSRMAQRLAGASESFFIGVDTAEGVTASNDEPDYNSLVVLNQDGVQVAHVYNRETLDEWAGRTEVDIHGKEVEADGTVLKTVKNYLPCTMIVEKNGPGMTVLNRIETRLPSGCVSVPMFMGPTIKPRLVGQTKIALASEQLIVVNARPGTYRSIVITDYFTLLCFQHYVKIGALKFGAAPGFFDDPVVALMWAYYGLQMQLVYNTQAVAQDGDRHRRGVHVRVMMESGKHQDGTPHWAENQGKPEAPGLALPARRRSPPLRRGFGGNRGGRRFGGRSRRFGGRDER
jgi:hypothetical protein